MSFNATLDSTSAQARFKKTAKDVDPRQVKVRRFMQERSQVQVRKIWVRTERGVSYTGASFKPYTPEYKEYRENPKSRPVKDRGLGARPGHPPDLQFTGKYRASWGFKERAPGRFVIGPGATGSRLHAKRGGYLDPKRPHVGFSRDDKVKHHKAFKVFVREVA